MLGISVAIYVPRNIGPLLNLFPYLHILGD
jgi:hypothetical protein